MRMLIAAGLVLAAFTASAVADGDPMASRYGNTVVVKLQNGPEVHMYYNADHTFTGHVKTGQKGMADFILKGTWKMQGDKICNTYDPLPPGQTNPSCNVFEQHAIGDTWIDKGRSITLVPGVQ